MSEVTTGPMDNRPDVQVNSLVYTFYNEGPTGLIEYRVRYEATCRFGCGSYLTPDVVQVVNWVNEHVDSEGHYLARYERLTLRD